MVSGLLPYRRLDPTLDAALQAAAGQARDWGQDYVGAEHVFCGILETEDDDGPGRRVLAELEVDPAEVRARVKKIAGLPAGREIPAVLPMTARCIRILDWAEDIRCRRKALTMDAGHVMESMLTEGGNVPFHCVAWHLKSLPNGDASRPAWLGQFQHVLTEAQGEAWSFPHEALHEVLQAIQPALLPWDRRAGPQSFKLAKWWHELAGIVHQGREEVLVFIRPKKDIGWWERWWYRRFYARKTAALRALKNGPGLPPGVLERRWPKTDDQFAGSLERGWFESRTPAGRLRNLAPEDRDWAVALHTMLEENGQVPSGFTNEFIQWLSEGPELRYAMELDGQLTGCCGIILCHIPQEGETSEAGDQQVMDLAILTFGLIHPEWQGRGLGTTQLAARLVLARRLGWRVARVSATEQSVNWLERLGFHFWQIHRSGQEAPGFIGSVLLTDDDAAFLETWLGWIHLDSLMPKYPQELPWVEPGSGLPA